MKFELSGLSFETSRNYTPVFLIMIGFGLCVYPWDMFCVSFPCTLLYVYSLPVSFLSFSKHCPFSKGCFIGLVLQKPFTLNHWSSSPSHFLKSQLMQPLCSGTVSSFRTINLGQNLTSLYYHTRERGQKNLLNSMIVLILSRALKMSSW